MSAGQYDITIEQGATFQLPLVFKTGCNDSVPGTPIDVSAWTFSGQVRATYSSSIVIANFTFTPGTSSNTVTASLSSSVTALLTPYVATAPNLKLTPYVYDITALKPGSITDRIMEGSAFISPSVTR